MRILLVTNIVLQWAVIILIARRAYSNRLELRWRTTFFGRTRYGVDLLLWAHRRGTATNSGKYILGFNWRDPKTIPDYPYIGNEAQGRYAMPRIRRTA